MTDIDITYPQQIDTLPFTDQVSVDIGNNINALREAILNIENVLGLNIDVGLFTDSEDPTLAERLNRIEAGIAERNLVFRELNVSEALQVRLNQENLPIVKIGDSTNGGTAPVIVTGPLTVMSPNDISDPNTLIMTPLTIDVSLVDQDASSKSLIKGKSNLQDPLLTIHDTNFPNYEQDLSDSNSYAFVVSGNMKITGELVADYAIDHEKLLNISSIPTDATRGTVKHVTQGDFHSHRKGRYDSDKGKWIVDSSTSTEDFGILNHSDLVGIGTLPTHDDSFIPTPGVPYHVTGGDTHAHKAGDGAQIDHADLKNISPKFSNHVTGGDSHAHTSAGDGGIISHTNLSEINTTGDGAIHVTDGDAHNHAVDENGNPTGGGDQIAHEHLSGIETTGDGALHVSGGDNHAHTSAGDGGIIDHTNLSNVGRRTHDEIDDILDNVKTNKTGSAAFTASSSTIQVAHDFGSEEYNVFYTINGLNSAPPSSAEDVGVIFVKSKTSSTFTLKRSSNNIGSEDSKAINTSALGVLTLTYKGNGTRTVTFTSSSGAANSIVMDTDYNFTVTYDSSSATTDILRTLITDDPVMGELFTATGTSTQTATYTGTETFQNQAPRLDIDWQITSL